MVFDNKAAKGRTMKKTTFAILGGDARQYALAARLLAEGAEVRCYGLPPEKMRDGISVFENWREAIADADAVILNVGDWVEIVYDTESAGAIVEAYGVERIMDAPEAAPVTEEPVAVPEELPNETI
jgi:3-hydroxyisobutyrate dehydrogenase-like beta-hydroxyacid dehydrogenase